MEATAAAHSLALFLANAELVASTSQHASANARVECVVPRTYVGATPSPWGGAITTPKTAVSESTPFLAVGQWPEDRQLAELQALKALSVGWDGEGAAAPNRNAVNEAIRFILLAGSAASGLEPTLHVDGSVLLEVPAGGSLQFSGTGRINFAVIGKGRGSAEFDGAGVPALVREVLG